MLADQQRLLHRVWEHNWLKVKDWKEEIYNEIGPQFNIAIVKVFLLLGTSAQNWGSTTGPHWGPDPPAICHATGWQSLWLF